MSLVSYSKTATLLSILDFLYILLHPGVSEISFCIFGRSSDISHDRWWFWPLHLFFTYLVFWRVYDSSACNTDRQKDWLYCVRLTQWAVKCPCIYFSSFNTWHLQKPPAPKHQCCHLVPLCQRGSVPCWHPLEHKGYLGGAPGMGAPPWGWSHWASDEEQPPSLFRNSLKGRAWCSVIGSGPRPGEIGLVHRYEPANTLRKTQAGFDTFCSNNRHALNKILCVSLMTGSSGTCLNFESLGHSTWAPLKYI